MKRFCKTFWLSAKFAFAALAVFAVSLFFREQRMPRFVIDRLCAAASAPGFAVRCAGASFGFRAGLVLENVVVYDLESGKGPESPAVSVASARISFFARRLELSDVRWPRLPPSYYDDEAPSVPPGPLDFSLPSFAPFTLVLENPSILGIEARKAEAQVSSSGRRLSLSDVHIVLPDRLHETSVDGSLVLDLDSQKLECNLDGRAKPSQIRPLVEVLDAPVALPYMDAFTDLDGAVPTEMDLSADLLTGEVKLELRLRPGSGRYRGAAFAGLDGTLSFVSRIENRRRVPYLSVSLADGAPDDAVLSGNLAVERSAGRTLLRFDARSAMPPEDLLSVVELGGPATLECVKCDTPPVVAAKGVVGTEDADYGLNDIEGTVSLEKGSVGGFAVRGLKTRFSLKGLCFESSSSARGKTGGKLSWSDRTSLPEADGAAARWTLESEYRDGSLEELADVFTFDLGERRGRVDLDLRLSGALRAADGGAVSNDVSALCGTGRVAVADGHLAQMKLFAGLTELLADRVPGVSFLVNQTQASATFSISNGVFSSSDVYIEGGLVSIKAWGSYDIGADALDFTVRAQLLKRGSIAGMIVHPVTYPLTKLLLEFRVEGPIDAPRWRYLQPLERIFGK